ncbi:hypothetical protein L211DRAFT_767116, partial [Terfezia boudieri ATCC MYA-4762]
MSDLEKGRILASHNCQLTVAQIAKAVGRPWQTVKDFLVRYETRGTHENISKPGRP